MFFWKKNSGILDERSLERSARRKEHLLLFFQRQRSQRSNRWEKHIKNMVEEEDDERKKEKENCGFELCWVFTICRNKRKMRLVLSSIE